jgi:hypothetical protein
VQNHFSPLRSGGDAARSQRGKALIVSLTWGYTSARQGSVRSPQATCRRCSAANNTPQHRSTKLDALPVLASDIARTGPGLPLQLSELLNRFVNHSITRPCLLLVAMIVMPASAAEPARAFLDGLRDRGYHDIAIEYLDQLSDSPLTPPELKETILYEKALTLITSARAQRDPQASVKLLDEAQRLLKQFVEAQASHPKSNAARSQLGSLIFERARMKVQQAKQGNAQLLLAEARELYEQAYQVFVSLQTVVSEQLDQIPKVLDTTDRKQAQLAQRRTQLRADNLQTELLAAAIREETADTVPDGSTEHVNYLTEAASLYDGIYKNYRGRLAGFYARLYQGRCNQRLGKLRDALGYYGELLDQPNESEGMFVLKTKTLRLAMECWLAPAQRKFLETIKRGTQWLALAPSNKDRDTDWLAIRLSLAKAYKMQADAAGNRQPPDVRIVRESVDAAMKQAKFVASESGELQEAAAELVTALGGIAAEDKDTTPQTFAEAQAAGKEALDAIDPATREVQLARQKLAGEKAPQAKAALQAELGAAQDRLDGLLATATANYQLALQLADRDTPQSDVNLVRYFLCYLYYLGGRPYEAALVGDFVSQRYPQSAGALQCAKISLACYLTIFAAGEGQDRSFEIARLVAVVNHMADQWPGRDAEQSLSTLVPHMVNAGEIDHARQLTERIPETAAERGKAELVTGQAYWGTAARAAQQIYDWQQKGIPNGIDLAAQQLELERLQQSAREMLAAGFDRLPEEQAIDTATATALLSLARAYVTADDHASATEVLEHPQLGPLTLVQQQDSAVENPAFKEETYRTALQASIGSLGTGGDSVMEKAQQLMGSLKSTVGDDAAGKQRMLSVYTSLALSIEAQMKSAPPESKKQMSLVFESFLQQLAADSTDPGILNWVAETFAGIAAGFDDSGEVLSDDAKKYYANSLAAFSNLLASPNVPPETATQIQVRMADVMVQMRNFSEALAVIQQVLAGNANALNVQVEAARALQKWGSEDPQKYAQAIAGIDTPQSKIWGWGKIASATQSHQQFRDTFYEARCELARCQFELAKSKSGNEKDKLITAAQRTLEMTGQLYPTLGGPKWTGRFNTLLNQILSTQGKPPIEMVNIDASPEGTP